MDLDRYQEALRTALGHVTIVKHKPTVDNQLTPAQLLLIVEIYQVRGLDMSGIDKLTRQEADKLIRSKQSYSHKGLGNPPLEYVFRTDQAASYIKRSVQKVRRLAKAGALKSILYQGHYRFCLAHLDEYL